MAKETKLGVTLMVLLVGVFCLVAYRKWNSRDPVVAVASAAETGESGEDAAPPHSAPPAAEQVELFDPFAAIEEKTVSDEASPERSPVAMAIDDPALRPVAVKPVSASAQPTIAAGPPQPVSNAKPMSDPFATPPGDPFASAPAAAESLFPAGTQAEPFDETPLQPIPSGDPFGEVTLASAEPPPNKKAPAAPPLAGNTEPLPSAKPLPPANPLPNAEVKPQAATAPPQPEHLKPQPKSPTGNPEASTAGGGSPASSPMSPTAKSPVAHNVPSKDASGPETASAVARPSEPAPEAFTRSPMPAAPPIGQNSAPTAPPKTVTPPVTTAAPTTAASPAPMVAALPGTHLPTPVKPVAEPLESVAEPRMPVAEPLKPQADPVFDTPKSAGNPFGEVAATPAAPAAPAAPPATVSKDSWDAPAASNRLPEANPMATTAASAPTTTAEPAGPPPSKPGFGPDAPPVGTVAVTSPAASRPDTPFSDPLPPASPASLPAAKTPQAAVPKPTAPPIQPTPVTRPAAPMIAAAETAPAAGAGFVVVGDRDSYWSISQQVYGTPLYFDALAAANLNRIPEPKKLQPGMKVLTPSVAELRANYPQQCPPLGSPTAATTGEPAQRGTFYVDDNGQPMYRVGPDDTLSEIAQAHLGRASRWRQIAEMNRDRVPDVNRLKPGIVLLLPNDASRVRLVPAR